MNKQSQTPLSVLGEFSLISALVEAAATELPPGVVGPGDDCAVIPLVPGEKGPWYVLTTDALVVGRHFELGLSTFYDVGWKSLAVNLSDVAAMGGRAIGAVVALCLPPEILVEDLQELYRGFGDLARETKTALLGGDVVSSSELSLSISVLGICEQSPFLRSGAKSGDSLWVSGEIGAALLGLRQLQMARKQREAVVVENAAVIKHRRPYPRLSLAAALSEARFVSSMIDVSDGLLQDASHLAEMSGVLLEVWPECVVVPEEVSRGELSLAEALSGGDDYELLFTVPESREDELTEIIKGRLEHGDCLSCRKIGRVLEKANNVSDPVVVRGSEGERVSLVEFLSGAAAGYQHF